MLVPLSVRDVMTSDVETVEPDVPVAEAAKRLREARVGSLVVCEADEPVGIVTESDVVRTVALELDPESVVVREFMSEPVVTIGPEATLESAAELLRDEDFRRLPVVEDGALVGIVTTTDLAAFLPHLEERRRQTGPPAAGPEGDDAVDVDDADWTFDFEGEPSEARRTSSDSSDGSGAPLSVGDAVRFRKTLSDEDVRAFAEASGDTNRLHLDEAFAAKTRFGGRIAHGVLASGVVSAALARLPGLTIFLGQDVRYLAPVRVGETVTAVCEVQEDLGGNRFRLSTAAFDGDGERVIDGEVTVLIDELPAGESAAVLNGE